VCRLLLISGLLEPCLDSGLEGISRSVLFACCTSGLVGGRNANEENEAWDIARARETARDSWPNPASVYGVCFRYEEQAGAGNDRIHGATGDVARIPVADDPLPGPPLSDFSLKSPECSADLGRSIARPAAATSRKASGVEVRDAVVSAEENRGVLGRSRDMGRGAGL
jgi:hypothetical protein